MSSNLSEYVWEDLRVGLRHEFQTRISEQMMERFRIDIGDINPLHTDGSYARECGFRDRVVYGMLVASFYSTLAGVYLPGRYCLLHGLEVSFVKPVFVGEQLTVTGEVRYLNQAYRQAHLAAQIRNENGTLVSKAKLLTGVISPRRDPSCNAIRT
jgi:3-hydroxybutyryl-CoA dehydratase